MKFLSRRATDTKQCFDDQSPSWGYAISSEILAEDRGFLVNGELKIVAEVISISDVSHVNTNSLRKLEVNGFHVLPSQVTT